MKTVLVTGVNRGIGLSTARLFLDNGFRVIGTSRESVPLEHEQLRIVSMDLSRPKSIESAAQEITAQAGALDILINNAGVLFDEDDTIVDPEKLRRTLEINVVGLTDITERLAPIMNAGGHIVNVSSRAGQLSRDQSHYYPAYRISKTALNMYTKLLAGRLADRQIIVSSIHPGWVQTDMGGDDAPRSPDEAARDIFELAVRDVPTGRFWYQGSELPW